MRWSFAGRFFIGTLANSLVLGKTLIFQVIFFQQVPLTRLHIGRRDKPFDRGFALGTLEKSCFGELLQYFKPALAGIGMDVAGGFVFVEWHALRMQQGTGRIKPRARFTSEFHACLFLVLGR